MCLSAQFARILWQLPGGREDWMRPAPKGMDSLQSALTRHDEKVLAFPLANLTRYRVMPVSYHCNRHNLKVYRRKRIVLAGQQQLLRKQAFPQVQGVFGCYPRQIRMIIAFREMRQNHAGRMTVVFSL